MSQAVLRKIRELARSGRLEIDIAGQDGSWFLNPLGGPEGLATALAEAEPSDIERMSNGKGWVIHLDEHTDVLLDEMLVVRAVSKK